MSPCILSGASKATLSDRTALVVVVVLVGLNAILVVVVAAVVLAVGSGEPRGSTGDGVSGVLLVIVLVLALVVALVVVMVAADCKRPRAKSAARNSGINVNIHSLYECTRV
jgi:NADH:ubiquinone oxidoreductase subunit 6 (subunit J)